MNANKLLLWFTGIVLLAFVFTFPTRDRRATVDRIRMQVGAKHLVSKQTLQQVALEQRMAATKNARKPASDTSKLDPRGATTLVERQERLNKTITLYCNEDFNRQACAQWLNYCGESCRMLVKPDTWSAIMVRKPVKAVARTPAKASRSVVAANQKRRR